MKTHKAVRLWVLSVVFLFLLPVRTCLANPITPGYYFDKMIFAVVIDFVVDGVVLVICYSFLRQSDVIPSWDFVKYVVIVMIGGLAIDLACAFAMNTSVILYDFVAFILLSFYNFSLSRTTFEIDRWQAVVIGTAMGIFTNPVVPLLITEMRY